jgi:hypothetical protein
MPVTLVNRLDNKAAIVDISVFDAVRVPLPLVIETPGFLDLWPPIPRIEDLAFELVGPHQRPFRTRLIRIVIQVHRRVLCEDIGMWRHARAAGCQQHAN